MKRNIKNLLPMRRQTHLTTKQIANEQLHDIEIEKKLGAMANTAALSDKVPPIPLLSRQVRNSVIDTKHLDLLLLIMKFVQNWNE